MISYPTAFALLIASMVSIGASQLLAKSRITALTSQASSSDVFLLVQWAIKDPLMWMVGFLLVLSAACWYAAMIRLPVSVMMPMAGAVSPMVAIAAHFLLGETLTAPKLAAIGVIAIGVIWLALQNQV